MTLQTTSGGNLSATGAVTATAGTFTLDVGTGDATLNNITNNFGTLAIASGDAVSIVDSNALTVTVGAPSIGTLSAQTLSSDLTLGSSINATGTGDSIVFAAAGNFNNAGAHTLTVPGAGRWLVYSTSPAGSTEGGLTAAASSTLPRLYNRTIGGDPPASITEPGNHLIYSSQPNLTVTPDSKGKTYGANDPAQTHATVGFVSDDGVTDNSVTAGLGGSFARAVGETPGIYGITQGTFGSGAGYGITFTAGSTLTINKADLVGHRQSAPRPTAQTILHSPASASRWAGW